MKEQKKIGGRRLPLYVGLLIVSVVTMCMLRTCSEPTPFAHSGYRPSSGDTIDVAIDYGPMSLFTYGDTLGGANYDIMRSIADDNGLKVKFHPVTNPNLAIVGLNDGLFDIVVSDLPATADTVSGVAFTTPVYLDKQVLVQRRDSMGQKRIATQLDLAGCEVWVAENSSSESRLRNLADEIGDTIHIMQESEYGAEQLVIMVAVGDIPLAVVNEKTALRLAGDYECLDVSTAVSFTQFQTWGVRKSDPVMLDSINSMIRRFKATRRYDELLERYDIAKPPVQ